MNKLNNNLIICQARYGSSRLPKKVLLRVLDKPLLWYVIKRLKLVKFPNNLIIATVDSKENLPIINFVKKAKINYFAGKENDVLDRFYQTSKKYKGNIIVRITSDCPLMDPAIIEKGLSIFLNGKYDYVANVHPPTYPDGFDVEIFSFKALEIAWNEAELLSEREHVTPYIWKNPSKFKLYNFEYFENLSNLRLTVDTKEDMLLMTKIIEKFHDEWEEFNMENVINFLMLNPELLKINNQYIRNEGYIKSLRKDK